MQAHQKGGLLLSAIGLAAMLWGGLATADFRQRIAPGRFIVEPMNVVATPDGSRIVLGSMFVKLNVLDARGRIQAAWTLPTEGGPFRIELVGEEEIRVAPRETGMLHEYDLTGKLLREREDADAFERIGPDHEHGFTTPSGTQYLIEGGRVLRASSEQETVVVEGFASHSDITTRMISMGLALYLGVGLLVGGMVMTGRRRPAGQEPR